MQVFFELQNQTQIQISYFKSKLINFLVRFKQMVQAYYEFLIINQFFFEKLVVIIKLFIDFFQLLIIQIFPYLIIIFQNLIMIIIKKKIKKEIEISFKISWNFLNIKNFLFAILLQFISFFNQLMKFFKFQKSLIILKQKKQIIYIK